LEYLDLDGIQLGDEKPGQLVEDFSHKMPYLKELSLMYCFTKDPLREASALTYSKQTIHTPQNPALNLVINKRQSLTPDLATRKRLSLQSSKNSETTELTVYYLRFDDVSLYISNSNSFREVKQCQI
jgi:hypothetical protein